MAIAAILAAAALHLPAPLRGDFDHDGRPDVAEVIPAHRGAYQLIVRRGGPGERVAVIHTFQRSELRYLYITKARPGRWATWCGKGGGAEDDPCPRTHIFLEGDAIAYGQEEASEYVAFWNGRRFEVVLVSD